MEDEEMEEFLKGMAKRITLHCARNPLENIHAGIGPSSKTGDYSDVKVIDGYGIEIPWNKLSRISDEEMKKLNISMCNKIYTFLYGMFMYKRMDNFLFYEPSYWNEPEIDKNWNTFLKW